MANQVRIIRPDGTTDREFGNYVYAAAAVTAALDAMRGKAEGWRYELVPVPRQAKSPTADRHRGNAVSVRPGAELGDWYAAEAARLGMSSHALMVRALADYRDAHALRPLGELAGLVVAGRPPLGAPQAEAEAAE